MTSVFLDVYKMSSTRVSKDTAGGYGTENKLGKGFFVRMAEACIKRGVFWPNVGFMHAVNEANSYMKYVAYQRAEDNQYPEIISSMKSLAPDVIFLCSSLVCFETEERWARRILIDLPDTTVVMLGQVSVELVSHVDQRVHIVGGNYEFLFAQRAELAKFIENTFVARQVYASVKVNENINLKPMDWGIFGGGFKNRLFTRRLNYPIIWSRGCPYSCVEYCSYPISQGRNVSYQDIETTILQIKGILEIDSSPHIIFRDPVFSLNRVKSIELLQRIAVLSSRASFTVELHLKNCDDEMISAMAAAGVTHAKFGIESESSTVRKGVKRFSIDNDSQRVIIRKLKGAGIATDGMFILGLPHDNLESVTATVRYACDLGLDYAQFSVFTPYPGTNSYNLMSKLMLNDSFEQLNQFSLQFKHCCFSPSSIDAILYNAYLKFYIKRLPKLLPLIQIFSNGR